MMLLDSLAAQAGSAGSGGGGRLRVIPPLNGQRRRVPSVADQGVNARLFHRRPGMGKDREDSSGSPFSWTTGRK